MKKTMKVIKHKFRLRGKRCFVSVSIFKVKMTMFVLLQQLDLYDNWVAAPKLQWSWRLTGHSVLLLILALSEILSCPLGFVLWDKTDTALRRREGKKKKTIK